METSIAEMGSEDLAGTTLLTAYGESGLYLELMWSLKFSQCVLLTVGGVSAPWYVAEVPLPRLEQEAMVLHLLAAVRLFQRRAGAPCLPQKRKMMAWDLFREIWDCLGIDPRS